jgi:hypothetical protein
LLIDNLIGNKDNINQNIPTQENLSMLTKSQDHNPNYLATVIKLKDIRKHTNADRLQCVSVFSNNVITSMEAQEGALYIYFPLECAISKDFIAYTNGFETKDLNKDKEIKGYFNKHGRVRAVSLRGEKSEGFIIPVEQVEKFCKDILKQNIKITEQEAGLNFDQIGDHLICKKYISADQLRRELEALKVEGKINKWGSKLVDNQFNFHPDTLQLKREIQNLTPTDTIAITNKIHGCNFVVSNVLVKKKLTWWEKILKNHLKLNIEDKEYGMLYSSRRVIKNVLLDGIKEYNHFYGTDVWGTVAVQSFPLLKQGITIYGEIYGYLPDGKMIQGGYDYGCKPCELDFVVFRITYTNQNGDVFELSHPQVQEYCKLAGIKMPETYYYGIAKDLFPEILIDENWHDNFLNKLKDTYLEKDCHLCKSKPNTPAEGIMFRIDKPLVWETYKLKSFRFLKGESEQLDKEVQDSVGDV